MPFILRGVVMALEQRPSGMSGPVRTVVLLSIISGLTIVAAFVFAEKKTDVPLSAQTQACIACHSLYTPGIVQDWASSRHSRTITAEAMSKAEIERRISARKLPEALSGVAVGCFECHGLNPSRHKDNFDHFGFRINVVVSPADCGACHPVETVQFSDSKKAHAIKNLMSNTVYHTLVKNITGLKKYEAGKLISVKPSGNALHESCLGCHGTKVEVDGLQTIKTKVGAIAVPKLTNWPNEGVGRENPDGSLGACTACHPRHGFSIEVARKPYTCSQCHIEPDVPAWNVYEQSKHGNI
jgi:hydroxylamine dehydrogenase